MRGLGFDDLAGLDAGGADAHALAGSADDGFDGLEVDVPATAGGVVCVGDVVAELRALAAEFTFSCHGADSDVATVIAAGCFKMSAEARWKPCHPVDA